MIPPTSPMSKLLVLAAGLVLLLGGNSLQARQYALLVAIEDYSQVNGASDLPGCLRDLQGVQEVLETHFQFPKKDITVLTNKAATKANILNALNKMVRKADPGDSVFIYFTGHGAQLPDLNDDDETTDHLDEVFITYDFYQFDEDTWLLDDHLRASLSNLKTRRAMVLVDACHSGTGTRGEIINKKVDFGFETMMARGRFDGKPIEVIGAPDDHVLFASCSPNEVSAIGIYGGERRSLFTTAWLNVLEDNIGVPLNDMRNALHKEMTVLHPQAAPYQNPQVEAAAEYTLADMLMPVTARGILVEARDEEKLPDPIDGLPSSFKVSVVADQRVYSPGEEMVATVTSSKKGFLRLYYVDKTGDATLLFPNFYQANNWIEANTSVKVGSLESSFKLKMTGARGPEMLLAVVSPNQFTDAQALNFTKEKPVIDMGKVDSIPQFMSKGIEVQPRTSPAEMQIGRASFFYQIQE